MSQVVENRFEVGDFVRVIDASSLLHGLEGYIAKTDFGAPPKVYLFESDDKQNRCWFAAESLRRMRDSWAEPPADHIADAEKVVPPEIPNGWRELQEGEPLQKTDMFFEENEWVTFEKFDPAGSDNPKYDKTIHYKHIRKIETANTSEAPDSSSSKTLAIPDGWRELYVGEERLKTDLFDFEGQWTALEDYAPDIPEFCKYSKTIHKTHIRKIDTSNSPETPSGSIDEERFRPKRPVVYIAGPMRGIPHFNFPVFDAAKAYLLQMGYDVLSPADFDRDLDGFDPFTPEYETAEGCADFPGDMDFKRVVTRDLTAVTQCDAVALLPGWEKSKGAVAEIAVANWMGKPLLHLFSDRDSVVAYYAMTGTAASLEQFALWLWAAHAHNAQKEAISCAIDTPQLEQHPDCDILDVAASITRVDRQAVYGPPDQDFKKTADMWTGMFQFMLADGAKFEPRHVAMAMICIKLSRELHHRKRDNWVDIAGYARCGSLCSS